MRSSILSPHASLLLWFLTGAALLPRSAQGLRRKFIKVDLIAVTDSKQPEWVAPLMKRLPDTRLRLYCTGQLPVDAPCVRMESTASEEYAFLKHIVDNYDELSDVTVLTPRDLPANSDKNERFQRLIRRLSTTQKQKAFDGFVSDNFLPIGPTWDGPAEACGPTVRPFGKWYRRFVNETDASWSHITCTAAALGNVFAVTADRIRRVPRTVYQGLLQEVEHCNGQHSRVTGYYIERSFAAMFAERCHKAEAERALQLMKMGKKEQPKKTIDLVVASYDAPLDWIDDQLARLPGARLHLYCKGDSQDPRCIHLENVGTEEYAFMVHILRNYNNLADITIFTKDNMVDTGLYVPTALDSLNFITSQLRNSTFRNNFSGFLARSWFPLTEHFDVFKYHASASVSDGKVKMLCRPSIFPYGPWYKRFINPDDASYSRMHCTAASMHGIFAASKDRIRNVPRRRFVDLLSEVESCRGHNAFTAGHYMERSWAPLFAERCHNEEAAATMAKSTEGLQHFYKRFQNVSEA